MIIMIHGKEYRLTCCECVACGGQFRCFKIDNEMFCSMACREQGWLPENRRIVSIFKDRWVKQAWPNNQNHFD